MRLGSGKQIAGNPEIPFRRGVEVGLASQCCHLDLLLFSRIYYSITLAVKSVTITDEFIKLRIYHKLEELHVTYPILKILL